MSDRPDGHLSEYAATIALAQALVQIDTTNGNEAAAADLIAERLRALGIEVERYPLQPGRDSIIARLNKACEGPAICFSGHVDTVPLGAQPWAFNALSGQVTEDRIWGRGTTDMKAGVAAMVTAFERLHLSKAGNHVVLVLSASEETGCQGAADIADKIGPVGAMIIAEPTSGRVAIGHKGVLWLRLVTNGKAAHGSMPQNGVNAVELMVDAIGALRTLAFEVTPHPLLGSPTKNVGTILGGSATNIVPDRCECTLDVRLVPGLSADAARMAIADCVGPAVTIETVLALDAVATDADHAWIQSVVRTASEIEGSPRAPASVSYFTDASVLCPALNCPPVAIVGPGDPELAHQINESCSVSAIWRASQLYERLARDWA